MANKRQSKSKTSVAASSTRVLRPRTPIGQVTKGKAVENKGKAVENKGAAAGSPPKKTKAINKKQYDEKVVPPVRKVLTRSISKAQVAVQTTVTRKNPVRKCHRKSNTK